MKLVQPRSTEDYENYFELRWRILRKPWNQPKGSEQDLDENSAYHIMAVDEHQVIGVARLQFTDQQNTRAQLRYMAVDEAFQGKGVGRQIVKHMEQYAREQAAETLFFHARDNAQGFYKKLGYQVDKKSYLLFGTVQHYEMSKRL